MHTISPRDFHQRRLFSSLEYNNNILNPVNIGFSFVTDTHTRTHTRQKSNRVSILYYASSRPCVTTVAGRAADGGGSGRGPFNRVYFNTFGLRRDEVYPTRAIFFRLSSRHRIYRPERSSVNMYVHYANAIGRLRSKTKKMSDQRVKRLEVSSNVFPEKFWVYQMRTIVIWKKC